ncbi:PAS domain-containing protein [Ferrovibrio sp.]|uniref:PAS domain-containing protein n=1 Tax=Ferrovibrio sp. TaxID=1917215 RepID=UPI0035139D08
MATNDAGSPAIPFADDAVLNCAGLYWVAKCSSRPMPNRQDIDPIDMPPFLLPHISLLEWTGPGNTVRYRLCGTEIARRFETDPTGRTTDQLFGPQLCDYVESLCRTVRETGATVYSEARFRLDRFPCDDGWLKTRRLLMPLCHDGRSPGMILAAQTWPESDGIDQCEYKRIIRSAEMEALLSQLVRMQPGFARQYAQYQGATG